MFIIILKFQYKIKKNYLGNQSYRERDKEQVPFTDSLPEA